MSIASQLQALRILMPVMWMLFAVMASAVAVVYSKHAARTEFIALQSLEQERDTLNEGWGRLLLEQSTWASPSHVEQQAIKRLHMIVPTADMTVVIR
ncbi:MAG: cell division protein FtsL [Methylophaga sp.]|nr:MAG: cell division protein FtsL [Methylophaga sp.]